MLKTEFGTIDISDNAWGVKLSSLDEKTYIRLICPEKYSVVVTGSDDLLASELNTSDNRYTFVVGGIINYIKARKAVEVYTGINNKQFLTDLTDLGYSLDPSGEDTVPVYRKNVE